VPYQLNPVPIPSAAPPSHQAEACKLSLRRPTLHAVSIASMTLGYRLSSLPKLLKTMHAPTPLTSVTAGPPLPRQEQL
jgi:hypothetical protein